MYWLFTKWNKHKFATSNIERWYLGNFGSYREANKVSDEELENDTTESSQNSDPDVLDCYPDLKALTEAANDKKINENMARLAAECAGVYPMGECDLETGTLF